MSVYTLIHTHTHTHSISGTLDSVDQVSSLYAAHLCCMVCMFCSRSSPQRNSQLVYTLHPVFEGESLILSVDDCIIVCTQSCDVVM